MASTDTETGYAASGAARIYYEVAGSGPALVMIHAGVADSRQWNYEFARFSDDFRVLRYDMRGFGRSEPADEPYSNRADLEALLARLDLPEPLVLMGCSMGGTLAFDYALAYPDRVQALVLVGSGPSGLSLDVPPVPQFAEAEAAYLAGDLERVAELEAQVWFDGMGRTADEVDPAMRALALDMNRLALAHDARKLGQRLPDAETPAVERMTELAVPVLIVIGEHDVPYILAAADYMVANLPNARLVVIQDAAHLPNMDHPDEFGAAVGAFLKDVTNQ